MSKAVIMGLLDQDSALFTSKIFNIFSFFMVCTLSEHRVLATVTASNMILVISVADDLQ